jgi:DNA mismatch repair protein MutS
VGEGIRLEPRSEMELLMIPTGLVGVCIPLPKLNSRNVIRGLRRAARQFTSTEISGGAMADARFRTSDSVVIQVCAMTFNSILFKEASGPGTETPKEAPSFFGDLNLDQLVSRVTGDFQEYDLASFYYTPLPDFDSILYRQEIVHDLEKEPVRATIKSFAEKMRLMRHCHERGKKAFYKYAIQRDFLTAVDIYCAAVERLALDICVRALESRGMRAFRGFLANYVASLAFRSLVDEISNLKTSLAKIQYCLLLRGDAVTVRIPEDEGDYSIAVEETFEKFRREPDQRYRVTVREIDPVNHIQAQVIDGIAKFHPNTFDALDAFCTNRVDFIDRSIARFDREIQFYLAFLNYVEKLRRAGLQFTLPTLSLTSKEVGARETFDLVLAGKLIDEKTPVVCNDFSLSGSERILVVSGPNHGGKTTFARTFGQLHYLASLGLPVPGKDVRLFKFDQLVRRRNRVKSHPLTFRVRCVVRLQRTTVRRAPEILAKQLRCDEPKSHQARGSSGRTVG